MARVHDDAIVIVVDNDDVIVHSWVRVNPYHWDR